MRPPLNATDLLAGDSSGPKVDDVERHNAVWVTLSHALATPGGRGVRESSRVRPAPFLRGNKKTKYGKRRSGARRIPASISAAFSGNSSIRRETSANAARNSSPSDASRSEHHSKISRRSAAASGVSRTLIHSRASGTGPSPKGWQRREPRGVASGAVRAHVAGSRGAEAARATRRHSPRSRRAREVAPRPGARGSRGEDRGARVECALAARIWQSMPAVHPREQASDLKA